MANKAFRFVLSGGGTGGHIFPALAIAQELRRRYPDCHIHFVGARDRMEMERVPQAGFPITGLWISGLSRSKPLLNFSFPFKVLSSVIQSHRLLAQHQPDVVIGTGGFASGPLLYAANQRGIPTLLQEQNSYPGITNKWLASKARKICVAYEGLARFFPQEKILLTGNPIRKDLLQPLPERTEALQSLGLGDRPTLLILGGSLGAKRINVAVEAHYQSWLAQGYNVIWQTGRLYFEALKQRIPATDGLWMNAFIAEMPKAMAAADLVLSRAGAGTLSELEVLGKASLLVPSPNVAEDHQTHNARALAQDGAAVMIAENDLENGLAEAIQQLMEDHGRRQKIAEAALRRGRPLATEQIVDAIETLIRKA